jgi:hypothetical protein
MEIITVGVVVPSTAIMGVGPFVIPTPGGISLLVSDPAVQRATRSLLASG